MASWMRAAVTAESTPPDRAQNNLAGADLVADCLHRLLYEVVRCPLGIAVADAEKEVLQDRLAVGGMHHFGMELKS